MTEITNLEDITRLVDSFYSKVRKDDLLAPIFETRIGDDEAWPKHLQKMYSFWNAVLFGQPGFEGKPLQKHLNLPIQSHHFDRWLALFNSTIDEGFRGAKSEAKLRTASIAKVFKNKLLGIQIKY